MNIDPNAYLFPIDFPKLYQRSPANWVTTLSGDLRGTGYGLTLQLAMAQSKTATGKAEIILGKGATETVLFASEVFTVNFVFP